MNRGTANRKRQLVYLLVTWLLLWSVFRMLLFPFQLTSDSILASPKGLFVIATTGIMAIVWALGGPLLLTRWQSLSPKVVNTVSNSGRAGAIVWLIPAMAWFLAYILLVIAWPINPAMVDGPVIVLALFGTMFLAVLVRQRNHEVEHGNVDLREVRQSSPGRLGQYWKSLPAAAKNISILSLLALVVLLWFREALFDADVIVYGGDIFNQHYDLEAYISRLLRTGQIPFWNPYIYGGTPFLSHPQSLVFYPPQMILRLLPLNLSVSWAIAFHVWIAGAGMFALARWKGFQYWVAFLCALVYMLNGGILLRIFAGHVWLAYALSWFPLVWLLIIVALERGRLSLIIAAAAGTAMIILTGHPAFPIYILLFFGFYWIWVCILSWRKEKSRRSIATISGRFMAIIGLAFGLTAIQIIPTLVYYSQVSLSDGYGAGGANFLAISLADLTALIVPNFYVTGHDLGHYWELTPYIGVLFILLVPLAYAARRADWFRDFLGAGALASLAIALGSSIGIYFVLYYLIPPFRVARIPPRSLVIFIPTLTLLGGIGLQAVAERTANAGLFSLITRAYSFASAFILGIAAGVWLVNGGFVGLQLSGSAELSIQLAIGALLIILVFAKLAGLIRPPGAQIVFGIALALLGLAIGILFMRHTQLIARQLTTLGILVVAFTILLASVYHRGARPFYVFGFIVLVFFDLFVSGRFYIRAEEPPVFYQTSRLGLMEVGPQEFDRVLSYADEPDQYMLGQVGNIDGYNSGILSGYDQFLRGLSGAGYTSSPRILLDGSIPDPKALQFLGAKYVISAEPLADEAFEPTLVRDEATIYEIPGVLPRAHVVFDAVQAATSQEALAIMRDPAFDFASQVVVEEPVQQAAEPDGDAAVDIVRYSEADGGMLMRVETDEPGILVLSEPYFSERRAWVNGRETELLRVNLGFIGVEVPAGTHEVEIGYVPTSLYIGGAITASTILVIIVGFVYSARRRAKRVEDQAGSG